MKPFHKIPFSGTPFRMDDTISREMIYAINSKGTWKALYRDDYPTLTAMVDKDMGGFIKKLNAEIFNEEVATMTPEEAKKLTKEQLRTEINRLREESGQLMQTTRGLKVELRAKADTAARFERERNEVQRELAAMRKVVIMLTERSEHKVSNEWTAANRAEESR